MRDMGQVTLSLRQSTRELRQVKRDLRRFTLDLRQSTLHLRQVMRDMGRVTCSEQPSKQPVGRGPRANSCGP